MLKSLLGKLLPESHAEYLRWSLARVGWAATLRGYPALFVPGATVRVPVPGTPRHVRLRPGTKDQNVYDQVFVLHEYVLDAGRPRTIVDAGAHIGMASVFFAERYPEARILALEPSAENHALLRRNIAAYPNVRAVRAGLWRRKASLRIENLDADTWSFRVLEEEAPTAAGIPALSVPDVLAALDATEVDLFKMDIEGSEVEVLGEAAAWIGKVRVLVAELHDRFKPGCRAALDAAVAGRGFTESALGENVVMTRGSLPA